MHLRTSTGTTFVLDFQIFLISFCQVLLLVILFSFILQYIAISGNSCVIFDFLPSFFYYNVWPPVVDFTICFTSTFSFGEYSYHLSLYSTPYSLHTSSCMTGPTTSCLYLYCVWASLGQLHKICYVLLSSSLFFFFSLL